MEILELKAQRREETGTTKVGRLRSSGRLPANLYGYKTEPTDITVDSREFGKLIHSQAGTHVVLKLVIDSKTASTVILKEVQRHPYKEEILHVDFLSVALDEKITAAVPLTITGDSIGVREGGILQHGVWEVQVEALPTDLPDHLEIDVSGLAIGQSLHAADIQMSPQLTMISAPDEIIASVLPPVVYKEEEAVEEAVEGAAPVAEKEEAPSEGSEES